MLSSHSAGHCHRSPSRPWPEHRLYFSLYIPQKRHQRPGRCAFCFVWCLILNMWLPGAKLRHLLTYSAQLRPELYLSIKETIVTDNLPVAEKKLCILSHKSCRSITILEETLWGLLAFFPGAQPVPLKRRPNLLPFWHWGPVFMFIYILTNKALFLVTYQHLIIYYKCFHQVRNEAS